MRRFRPNIVVAGCSGPNQEDHWNYIALGTASFRGQKLCECCNTILVNPDDGTTGHEPLKTLEEYRVIPSMPGKPPGPVVFGKNVSVTHVGTVTIGSQLISDYEYRRPEPNELPLIIVA